jgi:outer membrane lipoprotein carrier protein
MDLRILVSMVAVALVGASPSLAQLKEFDCGGKGEMSQAQGHELLQRVQAQYGSIETLHGGFHQESYVAALDEREASAGEMWFSKPGKMRWVYKDPRPQIVVIKEGTLWMYQPDKGQVFIDDVGNVLLSALPVSFMMGLGSLTRDFDLQGACRGSGGVILRLVPHKSDKRAEGADALEGFDLLVDSQQAIPKGAKISSLGGNVTAIVFKDLVTKGVAPDPRRFVLDYPKGVDVMDRRLSP